MLMSSAALYSSAAIPVTITFDQNAARSAFRRLDRSIPEAISLPHTIRRFSPTSPALLPPSNTNLSVFTGVSPNGWWYLYAYDGKAGDYGAISNGWAVGVTTITPVNQITDLGVTIAASTNQVVLGSDVAYHHGHQSGHQRGHCILDKCAGRGPELRFQHHSALSRPICNNPTPSNQAQILQLWPSRPAKPM